MKHKHLDKLFLAFFRQQYLLYLEYLYLFSGYLFETTLHQIDAGFLLVGRQTTSEQIVGVTRWKLVIQHLQAESLAGKQVELVLLEQVLITAAKAFLEDAHCYEDADRGIGSPHLGLLK